jgi:DNA (cytosine-5)-methyltransferase 1
MNYYNEFDPFAASRLERLIAAGLIPKGHVDTRSITDVSAGDLAGYTQCHFFAGIGGWSRALQLAGVPETTRLWTGSCPCQPFSVAGKQRGTEDERHLWPVWRDLIEKCQPSILLGEQVASPAGRDWLSSVRTDLEALGYAVGGADLCAAGIGAPHIRQRLWFVGLADSDCKRLLGESILLRGDKPGWISEENTEATGGGSTLRLGDTHNQGSQGRQGVQERTSELLAGTTGLADWDTNPNSNPIYRIAKTHDSFWGTADWIYCRDEKWRCVEPGTFPLVDGLPERVGYIEVFGNAIVPQIAAVFIKAALE